MNTVKAWLSGTAKPWLVGQYEETKTQMISNIQNNVVATALIAGAFVLGAFVGHRF